MNYSTPITPPSTGGGTGTVNKITFNGVEFLPDPTGNIPIDYQGFSGAYEDLTGKPVLFSGNYSDLVGAPVLAAVATSGSYNDLSDQPTIPVVPTNVSAFTNDAGYLDAGDIAPVGLSGNYADLTNKPDLSPLATAIQNATNVGTATALYVGKTGTNLDFRTLRAGDNVTLSVNVQGEIVIASAGGGTVSGEANTSSSLGTGVSLVAPKNGVDLPFRSLLNSAGLTWSQETNTVTLTLHSILQAWANLTLAADTLVYATGADTLGTTPLTAFARTLLDDANAAAMQNTLALALVASSGSYADLSNKPDLSALSTALQSIEGNLTGVSLIEGIAGTTAMLRNLVAGSNITLDLDNEGNVVINGGSSAPVLSVSWAIARANIGAGDAALDGQVLSRATYPDAWAQAQAIGLVITEAEWQADPLKRGFFSSGDGSTTFRLPDHNGKQPGSLGAVFQRGDGALSAGTNGLIQRDAMQHHVHEAQIASNETAGLSPTKAPGFTKYKTSRSPSSLASASLITAPLALSGSPVTDDAGTLARTSTETRPLGVTGCWVIKLFGAVVNVGSADAAQLASDYANLVSRTDRKQDKSLPVYTTTTRTLSLTDAWNYIRPGTSSALTLTVPTNASVAFELGTEITIRASGSITIAAASGVTILAPANGTLVLAARMTAVLKKVDTDVWDLIGQTVAA